MSSVPVALLMPSRILNLKKLLKENTLDAYLVTSDVNIKYLTQFPASESWLLVTKHRSYYITDFRFIAEVKKGLKGARVIEYKRSIFDAIFQLCQKNKIKKVGFDENHFSVALFKGLKARCPKSIKLIAANGLVERLREIKDDSELKQIKKALKVHADALQVLKRVLRPGKTEKDVFNKLDQFVRDRGVGYSFPPIIASGPNSSYPHAILSNRSIRNNDIVLVDIGIDFGGYKSDLTRMFFLGKIPNLTQEIHDHVRESQLRAIAKIKDGVSISEVDGVARNYLEKQGLAKYFGHGLGHGVGLEIHESPRVSQQNTTKLRAGMIITIEPAVYIPNKFGIRLEEMVHVTRKGCEVISADIH